MADPASAMASSEPYKLIFDVTREGFRAWWFPAFGLLFVALGVVGVIVERRFASRPRRWPGALGVWAFLGFSVLWTFLSGFFSYREYATLVSAVEQGTVQYVEGPVQNFAPMPANGPRRGALRGRREALRVLDNVAGAGFNDTSTEGGPMRPGLQVRVGYVGDTIVHLEVR